LVYTRLTREGDDIWMHSMDGSGESEAIVATPHAEWGPRLSPDGRWLALISDKSGPYEIYVQPFPPDGREWQVSTGGGEEPRWSADGAQLFYRRNRRVVSVSVATRDEAGRDALVPGAPRTVLEATFHNSPGHSFEVSADGKRFLVNKPVAADAPRDEIRVVTGWLHELQQKVR
jgi:Tol biopolymer transport system component